VSLNFARIEYEHTYQDPKSGTKSLTKTTWNFAEDRA